MLRKKALIAFIAIFAYLTISICAFNHCSKGCNCTKSSMAVCDTLDFEHFRRFIIRLKIVNPQVPLLLKGQPFNVRGLENLNSISIQNATILEMDKSTFTGISFLSSFSIVDSKIQNNDDLKAFTSATNLRILSITNSSIQKFEFVSSPLLEELNLQGCKLTTISRNSFVNLPYLSYINLAGNNISTIDPLAFFNLTALEEVDLSNNHISNLTVNTFAKNLDLISIDLSGNPLKTVELNLTPELEKLVLKSVQLENISETLLANLTMLSFLDLSYNKVNISKSSFDSLENLEYMDLSHNGLKHLDPHVFKYNYRLQKIILDNNNFTSLPNFVCYNDIFATNHFSCKDCGLNVLHRKTFKHMPAIIVLNLSHNKLNGNLTAFEYLSSLVEVDLSYNNISTLEISFNKSTDLKKLNLAGNPITTLDPNLFYYNSNLRFLDVSFCQLRQLWSNKGRISSLINLNVAHNLISDISAVDLQVVPSIKILDMSNNPLQCNQNLRDVITWLTEHDVSRSSSWKTHEAMSGFEIAYMKKNSWRSLAKERCTEQNIIGFEEEEIVEVSYEKPPEHSNIDDNDFEELDENKNDFIEDDAGIDIPSLILGSRQRENRSRYSFLWPILVFVFTALSVLVIAANVMLLMLRSRGVPRHVNLPHIKIPQWSNGKLKKHSGSVYQPLSEEKFEPTTPVVIRKDYAPTHMPKSVV